MESRDQPRTAENEKRMAEQSETRRVGKDLMGLGSGGNRGGGTGGAVPSGTESLIKAGKQNRGLPCYSLLVPLAQTFRTQKPMDYLAWKFIKMFRKCLVLLPIPSGADYTFYPKKFSPKALLQ